MAFLYLIAGFDSLPKFCAFECQEIRRNSIELSLFFAEQGASPAPPNMDHNPGLPMSQNGVV